MNRRRAIAALSGAAAIGSLAQTPAVANRKAGERQKGGVWPKGEAVGLFIGLSRYRHLPVLPAASRDARALANRFAELGIEARLLIDPTFDEFLLGLATFGHFARAARLAIVYVAAHGAVHAGHQFVLPVDTTTDFRVASGSFIPETLLLSALAQLPMQRILLFDACREAPGFLDHQTSVGSGERPQLSMEAGGPRTITQSAGNFTLYAAQRGAAAFDAKKDHGPFAAALLRGLGVPGLGLEAMSTRVRRDVISATGGLQIPWSTSSLMTDVILHPAQAETLASNSALGVPNRAADCF